jgi:hypothetical protein
MSFTDFCEKWPKSQGFVKRLLRQSPAVLPDPDNKLEQPPTATRKASLRQQSRCKNRRRNHAGENLQLHAGRIFCCALAFTLRQTKLRARC